MKFSIITVCLNPGDKLNMTLDSVLSQTFGDWEVVLKDGGSKDGSITAWMAAHEEVAASDKVKLFVESDKGIYDAMNQAVAHAAGDFLIFLNCGDIFADEQVLARVAEQMETAHKANVGMQEQAEESFGCKHMVFYGDTLGEKHQVLIASAPKITGFSCYRNIPCHQSCFYSRDLCLEKPYDLQYKIRADYDHFLWCYYIAHAEFRHVGFPVSAYEGGGYSESRENLLRDKQEFQMITKTYMSRAELLKYQTWMACTLAPLRRWMAESETFSGIYHRIKSKIYRK